MEDVLGVGKVVEKVLDPVVDLFKKVAGPAAEEIGLSLRDSVHVYRAKRAYRLAEKFHQFVKERGIEPRQVNLKLLLPVLDYASVEDDEDLHTMWANLLANAADPTHYEVLPSFAEVLHQLSKPEAVFLQNFYENTVNYWKSVGKQEQFTVAICEVLSMCNNDPRLEVDAEAFALIVDDLLRLGLIRMRTDTLMPGPNSPQLAYGSVGSIRTTMQHAYYMSDYGMKFIGACQPRRATATQRLA